METLIVHTTAWNIPKLEAERRGRRDWEDGEGAVGGLEDKDSEQRGKDGDTLQVARRVFYVRFSALA